MSFKFGLMDAILAIDPNAKCSVVNEDVDTIEWSTGSIPKADILAKQTALQNAYNGNQYQRDRVGIKTYHGKVTYPSIGDQLDQLYHDVNAGKFGADAKTGAWFVGITTVKTAHSKP